MPGAPTNEGNLSTLMAPTFESLTRGQWESSPLGDLRKQASNFLRRQRPQHCVQQQELLDELPQLFLAGHLTPMSGLTRTPLNTASPSRTPMSTSTPSRTNLNTSSPSRSGSLLSLSGALANSNSKFALAAASVKAAAATGAGMSSTTVSSTLACSESMPVLPSPTTSTLTALAAAGRSPQAEKHEALADQFQVLDGENKCRVGEQAVADSGEGQTQPRIFGGDQSGTDSASIKLLSTTTSMSRSAVSSRSRPCSVDSHDGSNQRNGVSPGPVLRGPPPPWMKPRASGSVSPCRSGSTPPSAQVNARTASSGAYLPQGDDRGKT